MTRVTQAEFARMAGVNRSTVHKAIARGRLVAVDGEIEVEIAGTDDLERSVNALWEGGASQKPHHMARKQQWKTLRGMTHEEISAYHAEIRDRKRAINEQIKEMNAAIRLLRHEKNVRLWREKRKTTQSEPEYRAYARAYQKQISEELTDAFITKIIGKEFATPELIALKREQLAIKRALRDLNAAITTEKEKDNE